ncbi:MAG: hypothetical protein KAT10_05875, partial [Sulfurimonas sp.]|nr:hypothetical protein [Sulfurimonas sp.]
MKKIFKFILYVLVLFILMFFYNNAGKLIIFYQQLTQEHVRTEVNLQSPDQSTAYYVGAAKCKKCHEDNHKSWSKSGHPRMIRDFRKNPSIVVADFSKLPEDANFKLEDATYTIGGKFKQRFMLRKDLNGVEDYVLGNYQWNVETKKWQKFKPWKYWYKDAYPHDNNFLPTSRACDGCHFTGYMSRGERVDTGISCEACHGPGSNHIKDTESKVYKASMSDPVRQNEVCLQCHI